MSTLIIAEIAQVHDGSLGILHSLIDAVSDTGVDAIKFQTHIAEAESSLFEQFRTNFSFVDKTRYDYWKRMEFDLNQWKEIKNHCDKVGLEFMSSPFSCAAVDLLEQTNIKRYKIGSGEVSNYLILDKIARTGKEIILSSGMSSFKELTDTIAFLNKKKVKYSILQATTQYPVNIENIGLNVIPELKKMFQVSVGLSDHSGSIFPSLAAVSMGAEIIEVHVAFSKKMFGPDSSSSLSIEELTQMVEGIRFIEKSLHSVVNKNVCSQYDELKKMFGKSLCVNKNLQSGSILRFEDLDSKKPQDKGILASHYEEVIGRKINKELKKWDFLTYQDLIDE